MFAQLAEAEGELDEMTKHRDELQAVVEELEEKVQPSDLKGVPTLDTILLHLWHECTPLLLTLDIGKLTNKTCHGLWQKRYMTLVQRKGCWGQAFKCGMVKQTPMCSCALKSLG